jgi:hypothetical protein
MPRFFFDVHDGTELVEDSEGSVLDDGEAARREARRTLGEMARDGLMNTLLTEQISIVVRDESGTALWSIALVVTEIRTARS